MPTGDRGTPIALPAVSVAECRRNAVEVLPQSAISAFKRKITPRGVIFRNQLSINMVFTASGPEPFARTEADKEQLYANSKDRSGNNLLSGGADTRDLDACRGVDRDVGPE
jgi:hypothetical protein